MLRCVFRDSASPLRAGLATSHTTSTFAARKAGMTYPLPGKLKALMVANCTSPLGLSQALVTGDHPCGGDSLKDLSGCKHFYMWGAGVNRPCQLMWAQKTCYTSDTRAMSSQVTHLPCQHLISTNPWPVSHTASHRRCQRLLSGLSKELSVKYRLCTVLLGSVSGSILGRPCLSGRLTSKPILPSHLIHFKVLLSKHRRYSGQAPIVPSRRFSSCLNSRKAFAILSLSVS